MKILDILFPRKCMWCDQLGEYLCAKCKKRLEPHPEICPVTHRFSPDFQVHLDHRAEVVYQGIAIGFWYNDLLKKLILQLKYYHRYDISDFLCERLSLVVQTNQTLQRLFRNRNVVVTSIPSHRYRKYFIKWYNQSELLARWVAELLGVPYMSLLKKKKGTRIQAFLSRQQRIKNLEWVFDLKEDVVLSGDECVIIIDDITTTWSTINAAAVSLKQRYPGVVIWWVVLGRHI